MSKKKYNNSPPETERKLMELQEQFLADRSNKKVADEMFVLAKAYARSITLQILKTKNKYLPPERVEEVAVDSTIKTFRMYDKPKWKVGGSWKGQLYFKAVEALFGPKVKNEDKNMSLNLEVGEEGGKELIDLLSDSQGVIPWDDENTSSDSYDPVTVMFRGINVAPEEINECLDNAFMKMDMDEYFLFLSWMVLRLRKPTGFDKVMDNFRNRFLVNNRGYEEDFEACWLDLHSRLEKHIE